MAFRRHSEPGRDFRRWRARFSDALVEAGIPISVLEDQRSWWYLLEHAYFTPSGSAEPVFSAEALAPADAERLLKVLVEAGHEGSDLAAVLRRRARADGLGGDA